MSPRAAAAIAVAVSLGVGVLWFARSRAPRVEAALDVTHAARVIRRDAVGFTTKEGVTRDRARVRAIVEAIGVDALGPIACPPDYSASQISVMLTGADVYARRTAYVYDLFGDGGASPRVVIVKSSGCRGGPPVDALALRRELGALGIVD
ncbi:MAG: hypothetical protein KF819_38130 [Labilithrix sp.]|nr:hypothetical protein [Labilithrix sp.]